MNFLKIFEIDLILVFPVPHQEQIFQFIYLFWKNSHDYSMTVTTYSFRKIITTLQIVDHVGCLGRQVKHFAMYMYQPDIDK